MRIRHTFGRPIGAYQAVRHPIANMALRSRWRDLPAAIWARLSERPEGIAAARADDAAWQRKLYDGGYAGLEYGDRGFSGFRYLIWMQECARANGGGSCYTGLYHAGPTLMARVNQEKPFHLPQILKGESTWCQRFSKPGAGTDLANLRTGGEIDSAITWS